MAIDLQYQTYTVDILFDSFLSLKAQYTEAQVLPP